ncbi:MAG: DUF5010 domain-containing protein [Planctomycetota bacterium]
MGPACKARHPLLLLFLLCCATTVADERLGKEPPGQFFPLRPEDHKGARSFEAGQPLVATTYFYWYDVESGAHIIDRDGTDALTTHPADMENISYKRTSWHRVQLEDMVAAGVDLLMPVYWGVPGKYEGWSFVGLPPLVRAHDDLEKEHVSVPSIGMFYDTSILKHNGFAKGGASYHVDLTTDFGKEWFYTPVRDFFSLIPPGKWARVDGRPIVFVYASAFARKQSPEQFEYVKHRFGAEFGVEPFIVKSADWQGPADAIYSWGGAVSGPLIYRQVAALGPGYDHTAVPGRRPLIVERRDGQTYVDRWLKVLALNRKNRPWIVHVETWNEWHEGTDVAHSREYGRSYIVLTRLFADMWRDGTVINARSVRVDPNTVAWVPSQAEGLAIRPSGGDGVWLKANYGGVEAIVGDKNPFSSNSRYLYFNIYDAGCASFHIEYDNTEPDNGAVDGAFRRAGNVTLNNTGSWNTADFTLSRCRFMNRCNGADLRIVVLGGDLALAVSKIKLTRTRAPGERE